MRKCGSAEVGRTFPLQHVCTLIPESTAARHRCALFIVATLSYLAIALFWLARGMYTITGDEPHYLVAAHALTYNLSLDLAPVYGHGPWAWLTDRHAMDSGGVSLPVHGLGPTLLVALPYRFFGVAGAKVMLCVLAGLLVTTFYPTLVAIARDRRWSLAVSLVAALSLPNTMAAGQIYPDLIAGLLCLYLVYQIGRGFPAADRSWPRLVRVALAAGMLPWLQHRYFAEAVLFTTAFAARFLHDSGAVPAGGATPGRLRSALRSRPFVLALAVAVGLQLLALVVVLVLVPTLSYLQPHFAGRYAAMIALGVHLDQFHGLFFQNPLLFAGLAGLPLFARQSPPLFALWALVYIAMLAPLCVYQFAYGGWSFAGRYGWDLAPLWIVPLGYCVRWLLQRRGGRPVLAAVLTAAAAVQVVFALEWIPTDGFLIQEMSRRPVWALDGFYRNLRGALPLFADPRDMLVYPPNWVWVWLTVLVVALCELWPKHRALLAGVWAATGLAVAIVFVLPRTERPFEIPGVLLAKSTGRDDGSARVAREGLDAAGHLIASPHTWLRAGCYEVTLFYEASYPSAADSAVWESTGWTMLERGELPAVGPGSVFRHRLWVRPGERVANYQFRVWFSGAGQLRIEQLVIAQISCQLSAVSSQPPTLPESGEEGRS